MKIQQITNQIRNDIYGVLECEFCGATQKFVGYDDDYYHERVIPSTPCKACDTCSTSARSAASELDSEGASTP